MLNMAMDPSLLERALQTLGAVLAQRATLHFPPPTVAHAGAITGTKAPFSTPQAIGAKRTPSFTDSSG